jgi:hypothetical protein
MIELLVAFTPLLVLPIIFIFRFIGCAETETADDVEIVTQSEPPRPPESSATKPPPTPVEKPPVYSEYITSKSPDKAYIIHYWRLVDPLKSADANDMNTVQPKKGEYRTIALPLVIADPNATPPVVGSEGRDPAKFDERESLIVTEPAATPPTKGRYFDGGHVKVEHYSGLYTGQFTLEAWVSLGVLRKNYEYTLFSAGYVYGTPTSPQPQRGFRVFVDTNTYWRARLARAVQNPTAQNPAFKDLFVSSVAATPGPTHIALTVDNVVNKVARLYFNGKPVGPGDVPIDSYAQPDGFSLFIGVANTAVTPSALETLRMPMLGQIQEVVLYRVALSAAEIEQHHKINAL